MNRQSISNRSDDTIPSEKTWLAALLMTRNRRILRRFAYFYAQLRGKVALGLASAAFMLSLNPFNTLSAARLPISPTASIPITPGAAGFVVDGDCSLAEAIVNANDDAATHADCLAGSGADTITLVGNTYSYSVGLGSSGYSALPDITSAITIEAAGSIIERADAATMFRLFRVTGIGADFTLNNATLRGGDVLTDTGFTSKGGAVRADDDTNITITNSTISGNSAIRGGGVYIRSANGTISNSTFNDNYSELEGGAIYNRGTTTITNSTISGNTSDTFGGGFYNGGTLTLTRSIVSGNVAAYYNEIANDSTVISDTNLLGHSGGSNATSFDSVIFGVDDITATSDGTIPTALGAILNTTLTDSGGPTLTHALISGSPAIDVVTTSFAPAAVCVSAELDQRGSRRADGPGLGGAACDLGAFEYDSNPAVTAVTLQTLASTTQTRWVPTAISGFFAAAGAWAMRRKYRY